MSLFDGILEADGIPAAPEPAPVVDVPYLATIKRASNGQQILMCNVTPPPAKAIAEAKALGLPLFTFADIQTMRQAGAADPKALDIIIETRRVMGYGGPIQYKAAA